MEEGWKETMTSKNLRLIEKESVPKPKAKSQVRKAWEEYRAAEANRRGEKDTLQWIL